MAGKLTAAQGTGILLVTANVGSLFEDVSCSIDKCCLLALLRFPPPTPLNVVTSSLRYAK